MFNNSGRTCCRINDLIHRSCTPHKVVEVAITAYHKGERIIADPFSKWLNRCGGRRNGKCFDPLATIILKEVKPGILRRILRLWWIVKCPARDRATEFIASAM